MSSATEEIEPNIAVPAPLTLANAEKYCRSAFEEAWRPARHLLLREQRSGLQCPKELVLSNPVESAQGVVCYELQNAIDNARIMGENKRKKIEEAHRSNGIQDLGGLVYIINLDLEITPSLHGGVKLLEIGYVCQEQTADVLTKNDNILAGSRTMEFQREQKRTRRISQHAGGRPIRKEVK